MTELKNKTADVVFVSTADWDNPYWTNKQHVAIQLAKRGYKIFYVESQGLRSPTCLLYTSPSPRDLSTSRMPSSA